MSLQSQEWPRHLSIRRLCGSSRTVREMAHRTQHLIEPQHEQRTQSTEHWAAKRKVGSEQEQFRGTIPRSAWSDSHLFGQPPQLFTHARTCATSGSSLDLLIHGTRTS